MPMQRNDKETKKQIALRFLSVLILLFSFSTVIVGQTEESDESVPVVIPDQAMEQVVRKVLVWYFKPRNQKKVIHLSEKGLQKSWLPEINGIEFQLLSAADVEEKEGVYFFTKVERLKSKYQIGFAFGEPNCNNNGDSWYFRISKQRVRLWHDGSAFGNGCSHSSGNGYGSIITPQSKSGKRSVLLRLSPLRTVLATFTAHGSSLSNAL